jgi:hypothetical protein
MLPWVTFLGLMELLSEGLQKILLNQKTITMKTIDLHNEKEVQAEGNLNTLFKEALTIEELFSIRGGANNNDNNEEDEEEIDKKEGNDSDQQEDPLV